MSGEVMETNSTAARAKLQADILALHTQAKDICERVMEAQGPFLEPRSSVVLALAHLNTAANRVRNL